MANKANSKIPVPFAEILAKIPPENRITRIERDSQRDEIQEVPNNQIITKLEEPSPPQNSYGTEKYPTELREEIPF